MSDSYTLAKDVIHETFEGEVVIANLQGGSYYTLDGAGVDIWSGLVAGASVGDIAAMLAAAFPNDETQISVVVDRLVAQLVDEQLIIGPSPSDPGSVGELVVSVESFQEPTFERYTDMQQLLLLDPIDDVDDSGWPAQPT